MLGLDAAGKTTILYKLHIGEILSTVPTIGEQRSLQTEVHHSARHVSTVLSYDFYPCGKWPEGVSFLESCHVVNMCR